MVHDPLADPAGARHEYGIELSSLEEFKELGRAHFRRWARGISSAPGRHERQDRRRRRIVDVG